MKQRVEKPGLAVRVIPVVVFAAAVPGSPHSSTTRGSLLIVALQGSLTSCFSLLRDAAMDIAQKN